jgi:hypothetical protein
MRMPQMRGCTSIHLVPLEVCAGDVDGGFEVDSLNRTFGSSRGQ